MRSRPAVAAPPAKGLSGLDRPNRRDASAKALAAPFGLLTRANDQTAGPRHGRARPPSAHLVAALALGCLPFSAGVFSTPSIEKPVRSLMHGPASPKASDAHSRLVHAELRRVIDLLPPTMVVARASAFVLIVGHAWLRGFDPLPLPLAVVATYVALQGRLVSQLAPRIEAVKGVPSETGEIGAVREGPGRLAVIHHVGLAMALIVSTLLVVALWELA